MTRQEVSQRYNIPLSVLRDYERWGRREGRCCYDQADLEQLSLIMTLYDVGFTSPEVEHYLFVDGVQKQMLQTRREQLLEDIHLRQAQLDRLDYLRFTLTKNHKFDF